MAAITFEEAYDILDLTHRSDQDDHRPIVLDHYDRVNLANLIVAKSGGAV